MKPLFTAALCSFVALAACDSENPFMDDEETVTTDPTDPTDPTDEDTGNGFDIGGGGVPPGVDGPTSTATDGIIRYEERNDDGGGRAEEFTYHAGSDTFSVDNLAFDGETAYGRGTAVASLGPNSAYAVYEASEVVADALDGDPITQIVPYRAIVGISNATSVAGVPRTSFAIVRTGGYTDYGFGGFVYQRDGSVVMPTTGQARFDGDYAGVRIFDNRGGMEYVEADMYMDLDFDDPTDAVAGVKGRIYNRVAYDINGNTLPSSGPGEITATNEIPLPNISFVLDGDNGNASADGELNGSLALNSYIDESGTVIEHESGTYYAILAGDTTTPDGGEIVGIAVITSAEPRGEIGGNVQETGGFILYRDETYIP